MIRKLCRTLLLRCLIAAFSGAQVGPVPDATAPEVSGRAHAGVMEVIGHCGGHQHLCMFGAR